MIRKIALFFCLFILNNDIIYSQYFESFECDVVVNNKILKYPFTGGFNTPQFHEYDFNGDGRLDIYAFERQGNSSLVFQRNADGTLTLTREFNRFFPLTLDNFSIPADFNRDGILDFFTHGAPIGVVGLNLLQGEINNFGNLTFRQRTMGRFTDNGGIWYRLPLAQVYVAATDIPSIVDIDSDGDLDILAFDNGGSYVVYSRNLQEERGLSKDTMDIDFADRCFGKFEESGVSQTITLSEDPELCATGKKSNVKGGGGAHAGSTVTALDNDEDGDFDLLLGDLSYEGLVYLENGGDSENSFITDLDITFPSYDIPVEMSIFHGSFVVDVDGDNLKDIIVAPSSSSVVRDRNNVWYYKNNGPGPNQYSLVQDDLFLDNSLDFGSYSAPTFVDYNADGLMDILVAHGGSVNLKEPIGLVLFENVGSHTEPSFVLTDNDYLGFSEFATTSTNPAPCFGDLDNDDDLDLLICDWNGALYFFENIAGEGQPLSFERPVFNYQDIRVGRAGKPQIFDANDDGLMDIIIGEERTNGIDLESGEFATGNINYFQNIGTPGNPQFESNEFNEINTPVFGQILVSYATSTAASGSAAPFFFKSEGQTYIVVGSESGRFSLYLWEGNDPTEPAQIVNSDFGFLREGFKSVPAMYDIDGDNLLEMVIGSKRGGLSFFKTDLYEFVTSVEEENALEKEFKIFPNPVKDWVSLKSNSEFENIKLYTIDGQLLNSWSYIEKINLSNYQKGIYIIEVQIGEYLLTKKLVKI